MSTYTEEEAKTKWCPFARALTSALRPPPEGMRGEVFLGLATINRASNELVPECKCIASACMAWQQTDNKTWPSAPGEPEREPEPAGYCGLARGAR